MKTVELITGWYRDTTAFDPNVTLRVVRCEDGNTWTVRNTLGPGWPMVVRPVSGPDARFCIGMAEWEDWPGVARAIERYQERRSGA